MHRWQGGQGGSPEVGAQSRQLWDVKSDTEDQAGRAVVEAPGHHLPMRPRASRKLSLIHI